VDQEVRATAGQEAGATVSGAVGRKRSNPFPHTPKVKPRVRRRSPQPRFTRPFPSFSPYSEHTVGSVCCMSLRVKMLCVLGVLVGTSLLGQFFVSLAWRRSIDRQLDANAQRMLTHRSEFLTTAIEMARQSIRLMASGGVPRDGTLEEIRHYLRVADQNYTQFESFFYFTQEGEVYPAEGPHFAALDSHVLSLLKQGQENRGTALLSQETAHAVLMISEPLRDRQGQLHGALGGALQLNHLLELATHGVSGPDAGVLIIDSRGALLAGTLGETVDQLTRPSAATAPQTTGILAALPAAAPISTIANPRMVVNGIRYRVYYTDITDLGWRYVLVQPEAELLRPLNDAMRFAWGVELLLFLLAAAALFSLHRFLLHPIRALMLAHAKVAAGDYSARAAVTGNDELTQLAESFNHMTTSLANSEKRLRQIFESFPHPIVLSRLSDDRCVEVNPAFLAQVGKRREEVIGKNAMEMNIGMDAEVMRKHREILREDGYVDGAVIPTWRNDDHQLWGSVSLRLIEVNGETLILSSTTDITEMKEMEASLRASEAHAQLFRFMVDHTQEAIMLQRDTLFAECNPATLELFGCSRDEFIGHSPINFSPPFQPDGSDSAERAKKIMDTTVGGVNQRFEWLHIKRDGTPFFAEISLSSYIEEGKSQHVACLHDITERKRIEAEVLSLNTRLEERVEARTQELQERNADLATALDNLRRIQVELVRSEKMASLGALVAGVAHELNTPIGNAVTVSSTLLDEQRKFAEKINVGLTRAALNAFVQTVNEVGLSLDRNLNRAVELVGSFKQLAVDQSSDQRRRFDLSEVVQEVVLAMGPALRKAHHTVHNEVDAQLFLDSYPGPLGQVLMNLINNAVVHALADREAGNIWIRAGAANEQTLWITVGDDGCGIAQELLERIFDPFFTTRMGQGSSGLGLHIVFNLVVNLLGGQISVSSEPGNGAVFKMLIPVSAPAPKPRTGTEVPPYSDGTTTTIQPHNAPTTQLLMPSQKMPMK